MNSETSEMENLQELAERHEEVMAKLDELERQISTVLDEYLGKIEVLVKKTEEFNVQVDKGISAENQE